jgi:hypothetical protein
LPELKEKGVLTFLDLIELFLVSRFRQQGVSMPAIRETRKIAATGRFHANGRALIEEKERRIPGRASQRVYEDLQRSQWVLAEVAESLIQKLDYTGDLARRYWPLGTERHVVLDPARSFGKPIDAKTRSSGI